MRSLCVVCNLRFLERERLIGFRGVESDDREEENMNKSSSMSRYRIKTREEEEEKVNWDQNYRHASLHETRWLQKNASGKFIPSYRRVLQSMT